MFARRKVFLWDFPGEKKYGAMNDRAQMVIEFALVLQRSPPLRGVYIE